MAFITYFCLSSSTIKLPLSAWFLFTSKFLDEFHYILWKVQLTYSWLDLGKGQCYFVE